MTNLLLKHGTCACNAKKIHQQGFNEIKETILSNEQDDDQNIHKKVLLLSYGSETILTHNGCFVTATCLGDEKYSRTDESLLDEAQRIAGNKKIPKIFLPEILGDDWQYEQIISLAKKMGYFDYEETIFDLIEESNNKVFIDSEYTPYSLDGDWMNEIADEADDVENFFIWHPEIGSEKSIDHKEYFFSFNDLCQATRCKTGEWVITESCSNTQFTLSFSKDVTS